MFTKRVNIFESITYVEEGNVNWVVCSHISDLLDSMLRFLKDVYDAINYLLQKDELDTAQKERQQIGFKT